MNEDKVIWINNSVRIPLSEIEFRFASSSGPGGQHANRTATKVTLLFNVALSPSLTEAQRQRLLQKLATRLDKNGVLRLQVQETRSQHRNRETAVARLQVLLREGLAIPKKRRKTRPSRTVVEKRLAEKKKRGAKKKDRSQKW